MWKLFRSARAESGHAAQGQLRLHFNYHAQLDPEIVLEVLRRLRLRAE